MIFGRPLETLMGARKVFLPGIAAVLSVACGIADVSAQEQALTAAFNASGQALFRQFASQTGNIVISPYSIGTAMAMALSGARSTTETEMASALKHRLPRTEIDAANAMLLATLNGYDKSSVQPICPPSMKLDGERCTFDPGIDRCPPLSRRENGICMAVPTVLPWAKVLAANALMLPKRTDAISFGYVDLLKEKYQAEVFRGAGLDEINGWVKQKTAGKIEKVLDRLDPDFAAVLLNAIYFRAAWASPFSKQATMEGIFNLSRVRQARVPTMRRLGRYALVTRQIYRAIHLPYAVRSLGMIVVLPNELEGLADVSKRLDMAELSELLAALRAAKSQQMVALGLPRFKTAFRADLKQAFQQEGMFQAFSRDQADFSGMTGRPAAQPRLAIGQIKHAAVIDVQEEGTEAAVATAVVMVPASVPLREVAFLVDRPFLFYLVDDASGAILFQGRIVDPR
jgi:serpin B